MIFLQRACNFRFLHNSTDFYGITKLCNFISLWQLSVHIDVIEFFLPSITVGWNWTGRLCCAGSAHVWKCKRFVIPLLKIHFTHRQIHHIATVCSQLQTSCNPKYTTHQPKTINVPFMHSLCLGNSLTVYSTLTQMFKLTFLQKVNIFQINAFFFCLEFIISYQWAHLFLVYCTQTWQ